MKWPCHLQLQLCMGHGRAALQRYHIPCLREGAMLFPSFQLMHAAYSSPLNKWLWLLRRLEELLQPTLNLHTLAWQQRCCTTCCKPASTKTHCICFSRLLMHTAHKSIRKKALSTEVTLSCVSIIHSTTFTRCNFYGTAIFKEACLSARLLIGWISFFFFFFIIGLIMGFLLLNVWHISHFVFNKWCNAEHVYRCRALRYQEEPV